MRGTSEQRRESSVERGCGSWVNTGDSFEIFFFSSRRRHTRSVSAFLLNRSSDLGIPAEPLFRSVKDCVTIDVLPRTPGNNVYVGFMVWSNFTATKCRGLVSLNQVIKEIICLQPLK